MIINPFVFAAAGGPVGYSARYWRLRSTSVNGLGILAPNELWWRYSGSDVSTAGKTITASDETYGAAANAFDGNTSNYWGANGGANWIKVDFATSTTLDSIDMWFSTGNQNGTPNDWFIEYSSDNSAWTAALTKVDTIVAQWNLDARTTWNFE